MRVINSFFEKIQSFDTKIAITHSGKSQTYIQLSDKILEFNSKLFQLNVKRGEVVFLMGDYSFESIALFFSLALNGNIIVPITSTNEEEINERIGAVNPDWVFSLDKSTEEKFSHANNYVRHHLLESLITSESAGLILFSSGSSGKPKAMIHNLDNLLSDSIGKRGKDMNLLLFLMFDHIGGINTLFNCLATGIRLIIPENRNPYDIAKLIEKYKVNILPASPTFLNLMLIGNVTDKCDLSSVRLITYGTEPMPESLLLKLKVVFSSVKFLQTFGTSETGIIKSTSYSSTSTLIKFDDPNQEYKIIDGELWLRSKTQVLGYINHSNERFTNDGWFMTGDLVEQTDDGFLKISGRATEQINVGGEKVLPAEVESIILELEFVEDCVVRSEKNSITGQIVCADVKIKKGFDFRTEKAKIKLHCRSKLESYKVPVRICEISEISLSARFKKVRI
jgi:acyl-coenzyme A synthetase/AMP-(fatty) acid ligase